MELPARPKPLETHYLLFTITISSPATPGFTTRLWCSGGVLPLWMAAGPRLDGVVDTAIIKRGYVE